MTRSDDPKAARLIAYYPNGLPENKERFETHWPCSKPCDKHNSSLDCLACRYTPAELGEMFGQDIRDENDKEDDKENDKPLEEYELETYDTSTDEDQPGTSSSSGYGPK